MKPAEAAEARSVVLAFAITHGLLTLLYAAGLAMAAFAYAENGDAERAEALGREALRRNPACPMGVHAVARGGPVKEFRLALTA